MMIETKRRVAKGLQLGLVVGVLVGLSGLIQTAWLADPIPALAQTVTVDSTQSPLVVNALADLADLTPTDGQSVIIKTGTEKGLWYYDKDSVAVVDSVAVLTGPGSVGRFLVINNDAGSVAAATAITAAQIDNDVDIEFGVFDADSARSLTLAELKKTGVQVVNVLQYGADPTGVANATTEIQAAIDAATSVNGVVVATGTFKITGTLYITCHFDGTAATFNCTGTNANSIIVQANKTANTTANLSNKNIQLPIVANTTKPGTGWAGQGTGVLCRNLDNCRVSAQQITEFNVGLYVSAYGAGASYSTYDLGRLTYNNTNLKLKPDNSAGWVNQNVFLNGRMGGNEASAYFVDLAPSGFGTAADFNAPNTNTFVGLSVEGEGDATGPTYHIQIAGVNNTFINTRFEVSSGTPKVNYVGDTVEVGLTGRNNFIGGYSVGSIVWSEDNEAAMKGNNVICLGSEPDRRSSSNPWFLNGPGGNDLITVFKSNKNMQTAATSDADWTVKHTEDGFDIKATASAYTSIRVAGNYLQMGDGSTTIVGKPYLSYDGVIGSAFTSGLGIGGYVRLTEMASPGNAPADKAYIYLKDNGAGKTQLMIRFQSGAEQQIAIEP